MFSLLVCYLNYVLVFVSIIELLQSRKNVLSSKSYFRFWDLRNMSLEHLSGVIYSVKEFPYFVIVGMARILSRLSTEWFGRRKCEQSGGKKSVDERSQGPAARGRARRGRRARRARGARAARRAPRAPRARRARRAPRARLARHVRLARLARSARCVRHGRHARLASALVVGAPAVFDTLGSLNVLIFACFKIMLFIVLYLHVPAYFKHFLLCCL